MTPSRRSFLGSVIGLVASTDFFARAVFKDPQRVIKPYRMCIRMQRGQIIQCPAVQDIQCDGTNVVFVAEQLNCTRTMVAVSSLIYDENWKLIQEGYFSDRVPMCNGDSFKVTHTLTIVGHKTQLPEKEIIEHFLKRPASEKIKKGIYG